MKFYSLFKHKPALGMIHLKPMMGYKGFTSYAEVLRSALTDAKTLVKAGFDGIIVENNYDIPHRIFVDPETVTTMTLIASQVKQVISVPLGISVLWNDYKASCAIAKTVGAQFIRVPVFVDTVETNYGIVKPNPKDVTRYRKHINAENILLFTDIHVKHATILSSYSLTESAKRAITHGSDGIIITGQWTGDAPKLKEIQKVRKVINTFPIIVGSGITSYNIRVFSEFVDGVIIGTAIKEGKIKTKDKEVNLTSYNQRISLTKARIFTKAYQKAIQAL